VRATQTINNLNATARAALTKGVFLHAHFTPSHLTLTLFGYFESSNGEQLHRAIPFVVAQRHLLRKRWSQKFEVTLTPIHQKLHALRHVRGRA
jgi:hypothetical protein